jgi:hypothetical protein
MSAKGKYVRNTFEDRPRKIEFIDVKEGLRGDLDKMVAKVTAKFKTLTSKGVLSDGK